MKVYLDDARPTPEGWVHARWPVDVIRLVEGGGVTDVSLDHDLDDAEAAAQEGRKERTGYDVALWLEERVMTDPAFVPPHVVVHSANPVGRAKIRAALVEVTKRAPVQWGQAVAKVGRAKAPKPSKEELAALLHAHGLTGAARILGVRSATARQWAERYGLTYWRKTSTSVPYTRDEMLALLNTHKSVSRLAAYLEKSNQTVASWVDILDICWRRQGEIHASREEMLALLAEHGSVAMVSKFAGVSRPTIYAKLKAYNIPVPELVSKRRQKNTLHVQQWFEKGAWNVRVDHPQFGSFEAYAPTLGAATAKAFRGVAALAEESKVEGHA